LITIVSYFFIKIQYHLLNCLIFNFFCLIMNDVDTYKFLGDIYKFSLFTCKFLCTIYKPGGFLQLWVLYLQVLDPYLQINRRFLQISTHYLQTRRRPTKLRAVSTSSRSISTNQSEIPTNFYAQSTNRVDSYNFGCGIYKF